MSKSSPPPAITPPVVTDAMRTEGAALLADLMEAGSSMFYAAEQVFIRMSEVARRDKPNE